MTADDPEAASPGAVPDDGTHPAWTRREMQGIPASFRAIWTRRDKDGWHYAVQLDTSHANARGFVHGGVLMSFVDHALSLLVWEASGRAACATIHLDSHFLSAIRPPAFAELDGRILRQGRSLAFARGVLRVAGDAIMEATGVWSIGAVSPARDGSG